jgi:hypothetical protein
MTERDLRQLPRNTQIMLGAAILAFVFTFLPFDGVHSHGFGVDRNAWHGFTGVVGCLLVLATLVVLLGQTFAAESLPEIPASWNVVAVALSGLAVIFFILRWLVLPSETAFGITISDSLQWGGYIEILLCIVVTAFALMRLRESGDAMPWAPRGEAAPQPPAA